MGGLKLTFRLGNRKNVQGEEESNDGFGRCGPNNKERAHCGSSRPETQVAKLRSSPGEQKAKDYHTTSTMASMKKIPEAFVMKGVPKALSAATQAERRNLPLKSGREVKITRETPLSFVAGFQTKVSQDPNSKVYWNLELGTFLELGIWDLELLRNAFTIFCQLLCLEKHSFLLYTVPNVSP